MKYLVLECHPGYAVVLGEDGQAKKVANMHYEVGQTVDEVIEMMTPPAEPQRRLKGKWLYGAAALAASVLLLITSVLTVGTQPYASVYLTINPQVRIDVDRHDSVIDVEGLNSDGEQLLQGYEHDDKKLDQTMDELVDRAIDMGFLHEGGRITLTLDTEDGEWRKQHEAELGAHLDQYLQEKMQVVIRVEGTKDEQDNTINENNEIVIPVTPQGGKDDESKQDPSNDPQTDYGESDYGESDYDDGVSDYGEAESEEDMSDYGEEDQDEGMSDYSEENQDDGMSDYGETEEDDVSDYDAPENDDVSDYDESESKDEAESDYDDDISDYNENESEDEAESDDDVSDYDEAEEDGSDYEEGESQYE